jgi:hypothetical protein
MQSYSWWPFLLPGGVSVCCSQPVFAVHHVLDAACQTNSVCPLTLFCFVEEHQIIHFSLKTFVMRHTHFKQIATAITILVITLGTYIAQAGGVDRYEIYLNNKLLLKQSVNQPLSLKSLQLNKSNLKDELVIYYYHCGQTGSGRKLAIKDEKGNVVKEWKFTNASGSGMTIQVKELLQLEKKNANNSLSIFYSSEQLHTGRMLTGVQFSDKGTTWIRQQEDRSVWMAGLVGLFALSFNDWLI